MCDYHPLEDGFYGKLKQLEKEKPWTQCQEMQAGHVRSALNRERLTAFDLLALLSPAAKPFLEDMAQKAQEVTIRNFGRTIQLFTPLYLANFCTNRCVYCGFNTTRHIERHMLSLEEVEHEALAIKATGLRDILALTGDAPSKTGVGYLASCVAVLARHFSSVAVEVPSMTTEEYAQIVTAGVSSVTLFQETYNEQLYYTLHPAGPKKHFSFRLDAPHRAISGGVRAINFGALLGLDEWQRDVFLTAIHADFLQRKYPNVDMSISLPRMRPCGETPNTPEERAFKALDINDTDFVQIMLAFRLFLPQAGITLSTREPAWLRDHLMPLGVTRMSAGVSTSVGGHAVVKDKKDEAPQFAISDPRSVEEVARAIEQAGYQPIYADWLLAGDGCGALSQGIHDALGKVCSTQAMLRG